MYEAHYSNIDASVNFIQELGDGFVECRFVQREDDQIIVYLSSHSGCRQACRFCHLTATGQTDETPVTIDGYREQLATVMNYWKTIQTGKETRLNINWMARGEALNNPYVVNQWEELSNALMDDVAWANLSVNLNISTIVPTSFTKTFNEAFMGSYLPRIYYSLYSLDPKFRKRWLPKAIDPEIVRKMLIDYEGRTIIHQAFIDGENDNDKNLDDILNYTKSIEQASINIVRYNPHDERHGFETNRLDHIQQLFEKFVPTQTIPRVGIDVAASCGVFLA